MAKKTTTTASATRAKAATSAKEVPKVTVDQLEKQIQQGGSGLKALVELEKRAHIDWQPETERTAARHALRRSFSALLERGELCVSQRKSEEENAASEWLVAQFDLFQDALVDWTWNEKSASSERVAALRTVFWFAAREKHLDEVLVDDDEDTREFTFGRRTLPMMLRAGMNKPLASQDLVLRTMRDEYAQQFLDFQLFYARALKKVFVERRKREVTESEEAFSANAAFQLLCMLPMPHLKKLEDDPPMILEEDTGTREKLRKAGPLRKAFQEAWLSFLRLKSLKGSTYRSALLRLPQVIPYLSQPLLLSDFLTDAFSVNFSTASEEDEIPLSALGSLFVLVRDYGLDYPNLYNRLYELVRPSLFYADKRETFCQLLDACLKSPMLPAYLIAAFCKRLARVSLLSPPPAAMFSLAMIYNLLRRHPNCVFLIHRIDKKTKGGVGNILSHDEQEEQAKKLAEIKEASRRLALGLSSSAQSAKVNEDPFKYDESDPAKCNATETSLWEIESLKYHYCPSVASLARSIFAHDLSKDRLTKPELPIADFIISYSDLYMTEARLKKQEDQEGNKRIKVDAALNIAKPSADAFKDFVMFA